VSASYSGFQSITANQFLHNTTSTSHGKQNKTASSLQNATLVGACLEVYQVGCIYTGTRFSCKDEEEGTDPRLLSVTLL
jgi:hypothetical protein